MEKTLIQWHPAFVAAMELELSENRKELHFEAEHNLNTKPLEVDLLVIKKETSAEIKNEIGKFFRRDNLLEYKSPGDQMDIDVLYKVLGYACLYKSYGKGVDSRPVKDITISLVREAKPEKLFKYFAVNQIEVTNPYPGIYYLLEGFLFPVQIIVTKELESDVHIVLKALTRELKKEHLWRLLEYAKRLQEKFDHHLMDSVLEVSIRANESLIRESKGDVHMYQALLEIMEPEIKQIVERAEKRSAERGEKRGEKRGEEAGIKNLILTLCELGMNRADTKDIVSKRYPLSEEELNQYLAEFF